MAVVRLWVIGLAGLLLAACAAPPPAPVTDRSTSQRVDRADRATRPEAHVVRRGDTLYSIAFRYGLDWRDVAGWNRIHAPYTIHPGDVIRLREPRRRPVARVTPPTSQPTSSRSAASGKPETSPSSPETPAASSPESSPADAGRQSAATSPEPDPPVTGSTQNDPPPAAASSGEDSSSSSRAPAPAGAERSVGGITWRWPVDGRMVRSFDAAATRKGIGITGKVGDPVHAAANGVVVYSGSGLLGYGELIIIKHSDSLLSAYGHNRGRRVEEGDRVTAGQAIGELGVNERNDPMLHFEIRVNGQPENPLKYLPAR